MKSPIVIRLEGWISFLIPFLSAVGGSALLADTFYGKVVTMICLALVGGLSGLKTFFSTTYSDSLPDAPAASVIPKPQLFPAITTAFPQPDAPAKAP